VADDERATWVVAALNRLDDRLDVIDNASMFRVKTPDVASMTA
jgi:hypothetical protein